MMCVRYLTGGYDDYCNKHGSIATSNFKRNYNNLTSEWDIKKVLVRRGNKEKPVEESKVEGVKR